MHATLHSMQQHVSSAMHYVNNWHFLQMRLWTGRVWLTDGSRTSISLSLPTDSSSILSNNCVSIFSEGIPSGLRPFHEPSGSWYLIPWVRPPPRPGSEGVRDVNKDSGFKAKARTKDSTRKAKARTKDRRFKAKARTKDLSIFNTKDRTKNFCLWIYQLHFTCPT